MLYFKILLLKYKIQKMRSEGGTINSIPSQELGIVETCRKYKVSTATFYGWKMTYDS